VGVIPLMAYTGRLCPKGVTFSGFRYIKGKDFTKGRKILIRVLKRALN